MNLVLSIGDFMLTCLSQNELAPELSRLHFLYYGVLHQAARLLHTKGFSWGYIGS